MNELISNSAATSPGIGYRSQYNTFGTQEPYRAIGKKEPRATLKPKEKRYDAGADSTLDGLYQDLESLSDLLNKSKKGFTLDECVDNFLELEQKDIGNICITGSVGLALQGKIERESFKDLDLVVMGELQLDDDIVDTNRGFYPPDPQCKESKPVRFNNMPMDLFLVEGEINVVEVPYKENIIRCQDYKGIIQAKLNMALSSF